MDSLLLNFIKNPNTPESNWNLALHYHNIGQTASAVSFYLRTAERTDDSLLQYECLIRASMCFDVQGSRNFTVKGLLQHAISIQPDRPEAYYLLSKFYEKQTNEGHWNYSYMMASIGERTLNKIHSPLKTQVDYPGEFGILFQKAVSAWWCGLCDESRKLFEDLYLNYTLNNVFKNAVVNNLKHLNVNISKLNSLLNKKSINKNNILKGFPSVHCMSLKESLNRQKNIKNEFLKYNINNINIHIFDRLNKYNHKVIGDKINDIINKESIGVTISHLKVLYDWYHSCNEEYAFFCEDDLSFETLQYWNFTWEKFMNKIPKNWGCVQLALMSTTSEKISLNKRLIHDWGCQAYIMKREYVKKVLDHHYDYNNDTFILDIPYFNYLPPVIEHVLFEGKGVVYNISLFVENINKFTPTYSKDNNNINIDSYNNIINLWKTKGQYQTLEDIITKKNKIIDFCSFYGPYGSEMLLLRYNILKNYVDEFVISESSYSHTGIPVEFECKKKIKEWGLPEDKFRVLELNTPPDEELTIEYIDELNCIDGMSGEIQNDIKSKYARVRDRLSKDALLSILDEYDENTIFIHGDIDEIINPSYISDLVNICNSNPNGVIYLPLIYLEGRADLRVYNKYTNLPESWGWASFMCNKQVLTKTTPVQLRSHKLIPTEIYPLNLTNSWNREPVVDIGWHFSWMGGKESRIIKKQSWEHRYDSFNWLITKKYDDSDEFLSSEYKEGDIPPCGNKNLILKNYPIENLPKEIFDLSIVEKFLFPS
jgi:GR25 family glycosyltransferase involved in LPS biosynthesis